MIRETRPSRAGLVEALRAFVLILVVALLLAVAGALLWSQVVDLPRFTRTEAGTNIDEIGLSKFVGVDGWFAVIGAVAGFGLAVLTLRRTRIDPVAAVLMLTASTLLAGWAMARVGLMLGPPDPATVAPHLQVGDSAPVLLRPHAERVLYAWPFAALIGSLLVLLGPLAPRQRPSASP